MIEFEQIPVNPGVHGKLVCNQSMSQEMEVSFQQKYRTKHSFDSSLCDNVKTPAVLSGLTCCKNRTGRLSNSLLCQECLLLEWPAQGCSFANLCCSGTAEAMAGSSSSSQVMSDESGEPPHHVSGSLHLLCPSAFLVEGKRDILFLFDGSANVVGQFPTIRDFLYKIIEELDVKPEGTRVAIAQFSDDVKVESRFNDHQSKAEILNLLKRMKLKTGKSLNLGYALDYALRNIFVRSAGSRIEESVQQFLVLLVAGRSTDAVAGPANSLKQRGVIPFIFQAKNANPDELELIVPSPAFILVAESLPKIGDLQPQIVSLLKAAQSAGPVSGMVQPRNPAP